MAWIAACDVDDVDARGRHPVRPRGRTYAVYRSPDDAYFATDGHCTHEQALLSRRPGHGRDHRVPQAQRPLRLPHRQGARRARLRRPPDLPDKVEDGTVYIELP